MFENNEGKDIIDSPYFEIDPREKILTKNIEENKNELIIKHGEEYFKLNRILLNEKLNSLKEFSNYKLNTLPEEKEKIFEEIVSVLKILYKVPSIYEMVLREIKQIFNSETEIEPGTIKSFFIGCFSKDNFEGPLGCNPKCAASLPSPEGSYLNTDCEDQVLIFENNSFSRLNNKNSNSAYIFIAEKGFKEFSKENINELKKAGIEKVQLIFPTKESYKNRTINLLEEKVNKKEENSNVFLALSLTLSIIVIVVIIILFFMLRKRR